MGQREERMTVGRTGGGSIASLKFVRFLWVLCLPLLLGCAAALPDVSTLMEESSGITGTPRVAGPRGTLPARRSERIFSRLERQAGPTDLLQANALLMESLTGHPLTVGNRATLLVDGPATFSAMSTAITGATDHINLETFIFADDEIGRPFADLLLQKQAEGVQVNLIYDSAGSIATPSAFFQRLREGGINVLEFNPINPLKANRELLATRRDHRKVMVVDGKAAFTGGVNISGVYSSSASKPGHSEEGGTLGWRDTHVMVEGPAVAQFQQLFLKTWHDQKGPELAERNYFPAINRVGEELVTVVGSSPGDMNRLTYVMYVSAVRNSQRSVHLTHAYFVPDGQMMKALEDAGRRGVDVALVLPGVSDSNLAFYAGRSHYEDLLEAGVRLYERRDRMSHAKTAVIDGVWSTIGSTNLDLWSFMRNDEVNAIILGAGFANQMEQLMEKDIAESMQITPERWSRRPFLMRLKEVFARLISHWL